ncbi:MAG: murein L,D-transpeptidase [Alphaproteobacteria bacterium]
MTIAAPMTAPLRWALPVAVIGALAAATPAVADVGAMMAGAVASLEDGREPSLRDSGRAAAEAYRARRFRPIWLERDAVGPRARALRDLLADAGSDGLPARRYLAAVDSRWDERSDAGRALLDVALTRAFLAFALDLWYGRPPPKVVDDSLTRRHEKLDVARLLAAVASADPAALQRQVAELRPPHQQYQRLRAALARFAGAPIEEDAVAEGPVLRPGMRDARVGNLRERLGEEGDWTPAEILAFAAPNDREGGDWAVYDDGIARAVRRFQRRHQLADDGRVGERTLWAINMDDRERRRLVIENMEKLRWLPRRLEPNHIVVNMAGFDLTLFQGGVEKLTMKVVVGQPFRQTPIMRSDITDLVLNPPWNVPDSIARADLAPKQRSDPRYLPGRGIRALAGWGADAMEVPLNTVDFARMSSPFGGVRLRQDPGPKNALGRIKFNMQNQHAIYLHDTPDRHLFDRSARNFSSGCIRLEKPMALAEILLADQPGWPVERVQGAIDSLETRSVPLRRRWPVYLVYQTAWVDDAGTLVFRDDIYGLRPAPAGSPPQQSSAR